MKRGNKGTALPPGNDAELPGSEWRLGWPIVLASFFGVGLATVESRILGVMIKPLSENFGWTRGEISIAPLMLSAGGLLVSPAVGWIVDRVGARTLAIAAIPLFSALLSLLSLAQGNLRLFYLLFAFTALVGPAVGPITWSLGVTSFFTRSRGAALGVAMSGIAAFGTLTPIVTQQAFAALGINLFWVGMGAYCMLIAYPTTLLFFRDGHASYRARKHDHGVKNGRVISEAAAATGMNVHSVLRSARFWRMAAGFFIAAGVSGLFSVHFVAMLTDNGIAPQEAAMIFGAMGPATMAGRLLGGALLDRVFAPYFSASVLAFPLLACCVMLATGASSVSVGIAIALMVGFALGSEGDLVAYLASRYFGLRHYGKIYGILFGIYGLGFGAGSFAGGIAFDLTRSYNAALIAYSLLLLIAVGLLATLGAYPATFAPNEESHD